MNHLAFNFSDNFWRKRQAALRFNKAFKDGMDSFREQIGVIKADHAARGVLMSGATIKRGLAAYEDSISGSLEICFDYISAQTDHNGWVRRRHVSLLDGLLGVYLDRFNEILVEHCVKIAGGGGAAAEAAEAQRLKLNEKLHDRIQRFSEGIGAPKPEKWVSRHPIAAGAIGSIVALLLAYAFGLFGIK